jgi:uncharacterized protein (TIGR00297 family)
MNSPLWLFITAQLFSLSVGIVSYKRGSISVSGLLALVLISSLFIWMDKIAFLFVLFFMFASSSILTKYKKSQKKEFDLVVAKSGPRDYIQAICNLGIATISIIIYHITKEDALIAAMVGSVAAANADSWASEIGGLSKQQPIMITTFKPVQKGISGGVTLTGMLGGFVGSLFIVATAVGAMYLINPFKGNIWILIVTTFLAGIFGFIFDSYLGAVFQSLYKNSSDRLTENSEGKQLVKGIRWMNNDVVNFITTLVGAVVAGGIYYFGT